MRKMTWYVSVATLITCAAASSAAAQTFMTLDRPDDAGRFGFQLDLTRPDDTELIELGIRAELFGNFLLGRAGGLYAQLPLSWMILDDAEDEAAMQNLEVGGFYLVGHSARGVVLRGGLSLPTAEDGEGALANVLSSYARLTDIVGILPDSTWLRLSASPLIREGNLFLRLDAGLDLLLDDDDRESENDVFGRVNAGLGVMGGGAAFTFELVNVGNLDGEGDADERWLHSLAVGATILGAPAFHIGLVLPLDEGVRGELWILTLGLQGTM